MGRADLERVLEIEGLSFRVPWSRESFETEFLKPDGRRWVIESEGRVEGYCIAWKAADELHIGNLAVHPEKRRSGLAEALMRHAIDASEGCIWILLEVRRSNAPARRLYEKLLFREAGVRKGYYTDTGEDALLLVRRVHSTQGGKPYDDGLVQA
jgi:[ribosomal protein S18]-alanine N-acetyltransferase